ncbi:hypothetical protein THAOC_16775, partial [Thalassiosira oceanica]
MTCLWAGCWMDKATSRERRRRRGSVAVEAVEGGGVDLSCRPRTSKTSEAGGEDESSYPRRPSPTKYVVALTPSSSSWAARPRVEAMRLEGSTRATRYSRHDAHAHGARRGAQEVEVCHVRRGRGEPEAKTEATGRAAGDGEGSRGTHPAVVEGHVPDARAPPP